MELKNLRVYGNKTRYAVHDDFAESAYTDYTDYYYRYVEDCIIESTNATMGQAYGSGTHSGAIWKFKNVDFIGGFSWHSNTTFTYPNDITLENCKVESRNYTGVVLKSLASGVANKIHIIGCSVPMITCTEETSGDGMDYTIDGHGNNEIPIDFSAVTGTKTIPFFSDCMVEIKGGAANYLRECLFINLPISGYPFDKKPPQIKRYRPEDIAKTAKR